jgi:hypothetical protein
MQREIVCICGSTRFWREIGEANLHETLAGRIVLSIAGGASDDALFAGLSAEALTAVQSDLAALHRDKITLADSVLVVNVGDYVGPSTFAELAFARELRKPVSWWEWPSAHSLPGDAAVR